MSQAASQTPTTLIGPDTHLSGTLTFEGGAKVLGRIDGKILGTGEIHIAQQAVCRTTIEAKTVTIDGTVEGNILAKERVLLNAGARVTGEIVTESLTIAPGAVYQGNIRVGTTGGSTTIETKLGSAVSASTTTELTHDEATPVTSWPAAKPAGIGAALSNLGAGRSTWGSQR